ncbi:acetyltransferase [Hymenobacter sp. RP-2-7]|uniref:Acetyltransferase n=1 Tax=Hymenobacter polaris TaxID=2682546 RepID=A0A7Y0FND9_9BACT|nr:acetyltransferase [Hymenobacter polaris]NML66481.1 acetyltransferase [Hymenobacter polaris]
MTQLFFSDYDAPEAASPLVIFGAGGLGREVLVLLRQFNEAQPTWTLRGFYDDQPPATATLGGLPYLGTAADLNATTEPLAVAVAVGSPTARAAVVARLTSPQLSFPTLVHPSVALQPYQNVVVGAGTIIQQGVILTTDLRIGQFVVLNLGTTVGHDAVVEDFCSLMCHVDVSGHAHIETGCYLGTKATIIQGRRLGAHSTLGAGAVAVHDLPAGCVAAGVPAKILPTKSAA